jgi:ubiquinone/menaquinone biosynthesis C-methylase UbiE
MESLPFQDGEFDMITIAGGLSYGDNYKVLMETYRLLKQGGVFVCIDSLNNNLIYRFNRWLHYLRGNRTASTLSRMPNLALIDCYQKKFGDLNVRYFGGLTFLAPMLVLFVGASFEKFQDWFDRVFKVKRSAFKFVVVAVKI